jgi:HK97 family phage prohead protease
MISKDREYRSFDFEMNEMQATGIPVVFDRPTVMFELDGIKYYEVVSSRAFDGSVIDDVVLNVEHSGKPAAKTKNATLELMVKSDGLHMRADLSKNATGRELHEDIKNGFYDKMSYAYTVAKESYDTKTRTRTVEQIDRLYDVSCVTFPAYNQTSIQARSFFEAEAERERMEIRNKIEIEKAKYFYLGGTQK